MILLDKLAGAVEAVATAFSQVFLWKTDGRTQSQNDLDQRMAKASKEHQEAIDAGDVDRINVTRQRELDLVREAQAKRGR